MSRKNIETYTGCLVGGAVGDALSAPATILSMEQIRSQFGETGINDFAEAFGRTGSITSITQMTLFTAEGLVLSKVRQEYEGDTGVIQAVYHALLRWLYTQNTNQHDSLIQNYGTCSIVDGVLTGYKELFSTRAPEQTCLSSLQSGKMGTVTDPVNISRDCGALTRMAPVGLAYDDAEKAFYFGCQLAAVTHGHPTGYLAAGTFAALLSLIVSGKTLPEAIEDSCLILKTDKNHEETLRAADKALDMAGANSADPETIEKTGTGRTSDEALAISLYCSLSAEDKFEKGVLTAVNHSGSSNSTGSLTGNILGAVSGIESIHENWLSELELSEVIKETATDIFEQF